MANNRRARTGLVERSPDLAEGHRSLARVRERQGRSTDALEQWEHVVRIEPDDLEGGLSLARSALEAGRRDRARAAVEHLLREEGDGAPASIRERAERPRARLGD